MCQKTGYCIEKALYCDKIVHCLDGSDESEDCNSKSLSSLFYYLYVSNIEKIYVSRYFKGSRIKADKQEFPITEVMALCAFIVLLIIILSFCAHCRIQSKKSKQLLNNSSPYRYKSGPPSFYRYSPAESVDVLGNK